MNTMKTLMLAAVAALTLGTGAAMAQEQGGPSFAPTTWPASPQVNENHSVQFGSSDVTRNDDPGMRAYDAYNPYTGGN